MEIEPRFFQWPVFKIMNNLTQNSSELKLQLFTFIDTLPENKLRRLYNLLIINHVHEMNDFWDFLSDW
jgi:hypothetical protein